MSNAERDSNRFLRFLFRSLIRYSDNRIRELHERLDLLSQQIDARAQEMLGRVGEESRSLEEEILELKGIATGDLTKRIIDLDPAMADYGAHAMTGNPLELLGSGTAELMNWAGGHQGFAAQAGLWFNSPVSVEHGVKTVVLGEVNERIVEIPFALAVAGRLAAGSRVLDVGSAESTLALSLASLGLQVTALDPRPYPLTHPHLEVICTLVDEWVGPVEPLDAIFCISTLEHLGTPAYGQQPSEQEDIDRIILDRFLSWLAPGGQLVLTVPYGVASSDDFQRVYDAARLDTLLSSWQILERRVCVRSNPFHWNLLKEDPPPEFWREQRGVVLVRASPALAP